MTRDRWEDASAYDRYMGRWSRVLARDFVSWLAVPAAARWLEIGCGTGSLTSAILALADPASLLACDTSPDYVACCRERFPDPRLEVVATAPDALPGDASNRDAVVSSLVLNFLPAPVEALARMRESCSPDGIVAACVWDYAEGMELLRVFWDAAVELDPRARSLDEGSRFPICRPEPLAAAFAAAELRSVRIDPLAIETTFTGFDDFWAPFVDGPGPAPTYVASLSAAHRQRLADRLRRRLSPGGDLPIRMRARAWAARGRASSTEPGRAASVGQAPPGAGSPRASGP